MKKIWKNYANRKHMEESIKKMKIILTKEVSLKAK